MFTDFGERMPIADWLNLELEDVEPPLPEDWTKESLTRVTLYQEKVSPLCAKIRAHLRYCGLGFDTVTGNKPDSAYKKVPVIVVNERQLNGSAVIVKCLAPVLYGEPLSPEEELWETELAYGLTNSVLRKILLNTDNLQTFVEYTHQPNGFIRCTLPCIAPLITFGALWYFSYNFCDVLEPEVYCEKFALSLGTKPYFHGKNPGPVDISFYGTIATFERAGISFIRPTLQKANLSSYFDRVREHVPEIF